MDNDTPTNNTNIHITNYTQNTHTHTHNTNLYPNRPKFQTSNIQYLKIIDTHGNKKYNIGIQIQESKHRQKKMNQHNLKLKNKCNLD